MAEEISSNPERLDGALTTLFNLYEEHPESLCTPEESNEVLLKMKARLKDSKSADPSSTMLPK